jgi:hypothetical protein
MTQTHFFTSADGERVTFPHKDVLVISIILSNHQVNWVLVDDDSTVNILSYKVMAQMGISPLRLTPIKTPLVRIKDSSVLMKGALKILGIVDTPPKCVSL